MELSFTDHSFYVHGRSSSGVPFLVDREMRLVEPANEYLFYIAAIKGRTRSRNTWTTYANHLYEFFAYLEENNLKWNDVKSAQIAVWRDLQLDRGLKRSTVNSRLGLVSRFYCWAHNRGMIPSLPFTTENTVVSRPRAFLDHINTSGNRVAANELTLRTYKVFPKFLRKEETIQFISVITPWRNRLIAYLIWLTGLRLQEAAHLDLRVVPNPTGQPIGKPLQMMLDPNLTPTKGQKSRFVVLPYELSVKLWEYLVFERPRLAKKTRKNRLQESTNLFLNQYGQPLSLRSLENKFVDYSKKANIKATPHTLRHTYATYELIRISEKYDMTKALQWVRDRLGHSSLATTEIYVHSADLIPRDDTDDYQSEICALLREGC